jgi:signal transduction histidine kinase
VEKASESGIAAYLTKPPKVDEIDRAITIAMARHKDLLKYKKLVAELEENRHKLYQLNASKDRFFSILAHDLRSPVSSLTVFIDQLIANVETLDKHELREYLSVIGNTSKGLSDLLENLLLWASLQIDRLDFKPSGIEVNELVNSIETLFTTGFQHKNIKFINEIPANCTAFADEYMVNTILRNLISNAVKFTPAGGKISVIAEDDGKMVIISVKDNGVGIPDEHLKKIFQLDQPFSSMGTNGEKGNGLGLLLCKEMVEKNRGEMWVESIPDGETIFSFTLPRLK